MARTHVILPDELLQEIDAIAGKRKRGEFIAEAVERELKRRTRVERGRSLTESLRDAGVPEWATEESTLEWVRQMREARDPWSDDAESTGDDRGHGAISA